MALLSSRARRNLQSRKAAKRTRRPFRPLLEVLEDRVTPATRTWTGAGANDLWSNAANWDTAVPLANDDVVIPDVAGSTEVLFDGSATSVTVNKLTSSEPFRITGNTLTLTGTG